MIAAKHIRQLGGCLVIAMAALAIGCDRVASQKTPTQGDPAVVGRVQQTESGSTNARLPAQLPRNLSARAVSSADWFEDVTSSTGVDFHYDNGSEAAFYQLIESVGGGVAIFDYDLDGDVDLFFTGGGRLSGPPIVPEGRPSALFRNDGGSFTNVTAQAGIGPSPFFTHGCTIGDFDNDGFGDLFVAGFHGCQLFHNQQDGTFLDITATAGLGIDRWGVTGAWADLDRDGLLDLYVVTYSDWQPDHKRRCTNDQQLRDICGPTLFQGVRDQVWRNTGLGGFAEITEQFGTVATNRGLGAVAADFDDDGWIDIFVVNDVEANQLYGGCPSMPATQRGVLAGVAFSASGEREGSMGVDMGDFDGDTRPDLWYTNYANQDNSLLRKTEGFGFLNATNITGVIGKSRRWVGFGTGFADFDSDGWQDLFVANGHVAYDRLDGPYYQPAQLFHNQAGKRFIEVSEQAAPYFTIPHAGRGAAVGDFDNDGGPDLVVVHQNDPIVVLRNRQPPSHWVGVQLHGVASNRDAVGAQLSITYSDRTLTRWIRGGGGYLSHFDRRIVFPVIDGSPRAVTVKWPTGTREVFSNLATGQLHELVEGMGRRSEQP